MGELENVAEPSKTIVEISAEYQVATTASKSASAIESRSRTEYIEGLKSLIGRRVIATYEFEGITIGARELRANQQQYTRLAAPVVRQEVEVFIDEVNNADGSVFFRFPEGNHMHVVAEQASLGSLIVHSIVEE